ncbi:type VI secretion system membrane subunit TssM [Vibrio sp. SS-MA-C1-2]|uniref:type VI secretion protein IcmF/TssM N-terminal domain-containing protein n=1 Tax=Vibrio sp. SS-MA-C1-2 TaxID=2908646 RepID=UPI001F3D9191|nr:type VI secretion protein IcmF/TssM N-terminal domain-containing protein [Vibrio sp. SS-MA-C1-2]UJF17214.1 type VI secretion system membrane subunit TssM [Vibrio sp. SS-MA-C1-2]
MDFELIELSESIPVNLDLAHFWASKSAIVISLNIKQPEEKLKQYINAFFKELLIKRSRQPLNGVLCSINLSDLVNNSPDAVNELSKSYRSVLAEFNSRSGVIIPTYSLFTNMAAIKDFCELFSSLDETQRDQPYGALKPLTDEISYNKAWFDDSYDQLLNRLSMTTSEVLRQQLNQEYRSASLSGVFQLSALRYDLEDFLSLTFNQHRYDEVTLHFRGYFFLNTGGDVPSQDLLKNINASLLGCKKIEQQVVTSHSVSLFTKHLFNKLIVNEFQLVGVNRKKELKFRSYKFLFFTGLVSFFVCLALLFKVNYDYQQNMDSRALASLEKYKINLQSNKINPDDLSSPVFSLYELREIKDYYHPNNHPWYIVNFIPNSSIQDQVEATYYHELSHVLLILMRDYLLKDMFVYQALDDKVKTLELLNYHQILYSSKRKNIDSLVNYYVHSLQEEGEGDLPLIERFKLLAYDLLSQGFIPPESDKELLNLVRSSLSPDDVSELLYQHIYQHQQFAHRVDIRRQLSPSYKQVLSFKKGFSGYLIPYLFTKEGFEDLYNQTGLLLATEATQEYEGVMGRIRGEAELNRINRQLRERYINDYIRYWKALLNNVEWKVTDNWGGITNQLDVVSDPLFSPITEFYQLVADNTKLDVFVQTDTTKQDKSQSNPTGKNSIANQNSKKADKTPPAQNDKFVRVMQSISAPFNAIHKLVEVKKSGQTDLNLAIKQMKETSDWVKKSKTTAYRGDYFLTQLHNQDSSNPLARLYDLADSYQVVFLSSVLRDYSTTLNRLAIEEVRDVINNDWMPLYDFYLQNFNNKYPFNATAKFDANLDSFELFFKSKGMFDLFVIKYQGFYSQTGISGTQLNSFIPNKTFPLNIRYYPLITAVAKIQQELFIDNELAFDFLIQAKKMSPSLVQFSVDGEQRLFEYQNGPSLWKKQHWPIVSNQMQDLTLTIIDDQGTVTKQVLTGHWSWFKLASLCNSASIPGVNELDWRCRFNEKYVDLILQLNNGKKLFTEQGFININLPENL